MRTRKLFVYVRNWLGEQGCAQNIIVMGRSLGSASALELARVFGTQLSGLVIDSGFADAQGLLARLGARLPAGMKVAALLGQERKIKAYRGPALIIHGTDDTVIPVQDAHALFAACPGDNKRLLIIEGAGHNTLLAMGMDEYFQAFGDLIGCVCGR